MPVLIGTSGWQYRHWREAFYPKGLPQRRWLEYYAERFCTTELNVSFYRMPKAEVFAGWHERTPDGFVFAAKASRYITHVKRLRDPEPSVAYFMERAGQLGEKLGPILLQLPPNLAADLPALCETLDAFPPGVRRAVEPRHESWFTDELCAVLASRDVALCLADSRRRRSPVWRTAGWTYLRFHEGRATPHPCYGRRALQTWAERLASLWSPDADVYVYFNNDGRACALRDAGWFATACTAAGLTATRVPAAGEVRVAAECGLV